MSAVIRMARRAPAARSVGYVCQPGPRRVGHALRELWAYRGLVAVLLWRDLKLRHQGTVLRAGWNLAQPLAHLLVFTLLYGLFVPSGRAAEVPFPLFAYPALLLWQLFSKSVAQGGASLDGYRPLLARVYFPRMLAPLTLLLGALCDFALALPPLAGLMWLYGVGSGWQLLFAPFFVALTAMLGLGLALWVSALDASVRDVRHAFPFVTQIWMFASPVIYPLSLIPEAHRALYALNPLVGLIEGWRFSLLPAHPAPGPEALAAAVAFSFTVLASGVPLFNAREGTLVDRI